MTRIRTIVNPKWDLIGQYFREAHANHQPRQVTADQLQKFRDEIRTLQDAFLIAALTISKMRRSPPNLERAPFREISLIEKGTALRGADFTRAYLMGADFFDSDLEGANFTGADLSGAKFTEANLENIVLDGAILFKTDFSTAKNLDPETVSRGEKWQDATFDEAIRKALSNLPEKAPR